MQDGQINEQERPKRNTDVIGTCNAEAKAIDPIDDLFTYHAPRGDQHERYALLRDQAKVLARTINQLVPSGADKTEAMRKLRECVMTANAGIALDGRTYRF